MGEDMIERIRRVMRVKVTFGEYWYIDQIKEIRGQIENTKEMKERQRDWEAETTNRGKDSEGGCMSLIKVVSIELPMVGEKRCRGTSK